MLSTGNWDFPVILYSSTEHFSFEILEPVFCMKPPEKEASESLLQFYGGNFMKKNFLTNKTVDNTFILHHMLFLEHARITFSKWPWKLLWNFMEEIA